MGKGQHFCRQGLGLWHDRARAETITCSSMTWGWGRASISAGKDWGGSRA